MNHKFKLGAKVLYKEFSNSIWQEATIVRIHDKFHPNLINTSLYNKAAPYAVTFEEIIAPGIIRKPSAV